jgi:hypothetical protein
MKVTIQEAVDNKRNLRIAPTGSYGHFLISCDYRGKTISCVTTNTVDIDNFRSDDNEKIRGCNRVKEGYEKLCKKIIESYRSTRNLYNFT